jgi:DNA-binding transcriptional regulator YdaS (Cro superfamily)
MKTAKSGNTAHTQVWVVDRDAFTAAFRAAVARYPNQGSASKGLGVDRSRVNQLFNGRVRRRVGIGIVTAMRRALRGDPTAQDALDRALLTAEARAYLKAYADWIDSHRRPEPLPGRDMYHDLVNRDPWSSYLNDFRRKQLARGVDESRVYLAQARALAPLEVGWKTGGIELTAGELERSGELGAYLNAAFKREEILLRRTPDLLRRAQEVTAHELKPQRRKRSR